jgi:hypothetical protein
MKGMMKGYRGTYKYYKLFRLLKGSRVPDS